MKGKGECEFGCMNGRISGVNRGKAREGVALLVSLAVRLCAGMEGSVVKAYVGEI